MDIFKFVRVQVKATEAMKYLDYQVIGKGGVLASHRVNTHSSKIFVFKFWATFAMVPEAALVVYYYRPNGEIMADRVALTFDNPLDNYVSRNTTQTLDTRKFSFIFINSRPISSCPPLNSNQENQLTSQWTPSAILILDCWALIKV